MEMFQKKKKSSSEKKQSKKSIPNDEQLQKESAIEEDAMETLTNDLIDASAKKLSNAQDIRKEEKTSLEIINDIMNPPLMEFDSSKPYNVPDAVKAGDVNALQELDERKLIELKEVREIE